MAFLQLKSTNPDLSYIIRKNPASIMQAREIRRGVAFGYFSKDKNPIVFEDGIVGASDIYNIYFQDGANEISYPEFKDQTFEYVNATRFSSAQFVLNAISDFLREPLKKQDEKDIEGFEHTVMINLIRLESRRILKAFTFHFADSCEIDVKEVANKYCQITFKTNKSLHFLMNIVNLFCCFVVLKNEHEYIHLDDGVIEKYFASLTVIDAPYFIRYAFKTDLLRNNKWFLRYKPLLETSSLYPIHLEFGNTIQMRSEWIRSQLSFLNGIVDVGCGEGTYLAFANKIAPKAYYAIDINESCRQVVKKKAKLKNLNNVNILESLPLLDPMDLELSDFLLIEVLEHMSIEEAEVLLAMCLNNPKCNSVIITTPNKDFNPHYFDDEKEVRWADHCFEFTESQFRDWISKFKTSETKVFQIGDIVDGKPVTLGAVLRR